MAAVVTYTHRTPLSRVAGVSALVAILVAGLGGAATELGPWYYGLRQPAWKPPDWLFGPAWTLIFTLTAVSASLAWRAASSPAQQRSLLAAYLTNGVLNVLWSVLFFKLQRPDWALAELVVMWLSILWMMRAAAAASRLAMLLLLPYLLWVSFAGALNAAVVHLNPPFGQALATQRALLVT